MSEKRLKPEQPVSERAVEFQLPAGWKRDEVQGLRGISLPRTRYIGYLATLHFKEVYCANEDPIYYPLL